MAEPATVVLVHGAFHGPWCWEKVTSLLQAGDVPTSLADPGVGEPRQVSSDPWLDQQRVCEVVNEVARPVVMVGHLLSPFFGEGIAAPEWRTPDTHRRSGP
jgi:hypothetical protein